MTDAEDTSEIYDALVSNTILLGDIMALENSGIDSGYDKGIIKIKKTNGDAAIKKWEKFVKEYERLKSREQLAHELLGDAVRCYTCMGSAKDVHELTLDIEKLWFNPTTNHIADNLAMVDHIVNVNEKV